MTETFRPSKDIETDRKSFVAKAETLAEIRRTKPDDFTAEQEAELESCLAGAEKCIVDAKASRQAERIEMQKSFTDQPANQLVRTMPASIPANDSASRADDYEAGLKAWMTLKFGHSEDVTPQNMQRCQKAGLNPHSDCFFYNCNWDNLNYKTRAKNKKLKDMKRTVLSTGGSGTGADWTYQTYSDLLTIYGVAESPFVNFVRTDTTDDLANRSYFIVDNTAMISAATGGTETSPTVADTNMVSGKVTLNPLEISSGYQKTSYREIKSVTFSVQDRIAQNDAESDVRYVEQQVLNGTATASGGVITGFQGLLSVATNALGGSTTIAAASVTDNVLDAMMALIPQKYVDRAMWVTGRDGASLLRQDLKDTLGRPLFDKFEEDDVKIKSLKGLPFFVSEYMPASSTGNKFLVLFVPEFYTVRTYSERRFDVLREKFHPLLAWCGISYWGGAYLGPTGTALYLKLT